MRGLFATRVIRQMVRLRPVLFGSHLFIVEHDRVKVSALILEKCRDGRGIGIIRNQGSAERVIDGDTRCQFGELVAGQDCVLA